MKPSSEQWRKQQKQAFRFWHQGLVASDEAPETRGQYSALITHLKHFEKQTRETFRFVVTRGADPVYLLHVLIQLCDEERVSQRVGFPQVRTQEKSGSLAKLRDFHFVTEWEFKDMEVALSKFEKAGHPVDQLLLGFLRQGFESIPEPPVVPGVTLEKAMLHTEFTFPKVDPVPSKGQPGEHYFNTAMVLLARHLERPKPPRAWYTSIAQLLNAFCPVTYRPSPLSNATVRQRILSVEDLSTFYRGTTTGNKVFGYDNVSVYNREPNTDGIQHRQHVVRRINTEQGKIVVKIFELFASGFGLARIAKTLNEDRIPPPHGGNLGWCPTALRDILQRELYRGVVLWNRTQAVHRGGTRKQRKRPESEWLRIDAPELRIVSQVLWEQVKERRARNHMPTYEEKAVGCCLGPRVRIAALLTFSVASPSV